MFWTRREFMSVVIVGGVLAGAPMEDAWAQSKPDIPIQKMSVKMGHVPSIVYGAIYVALDRGYFAERGLDVELVITRGGDTAFQVAGGTLQFAGGSPDTAFFNGLDRGMPLMSIAPLANNPKDRSAEPLMVRKDLKDSGEVVRVSQLKGRKVANLVPGGITEYLVALNLKSGGLTLEDVELVTPLGFPQMVDAFTTKAVDAALIGEPFATMAINKGVGAVLENKADLGEQVIWMQTNREFAEKNPAIVTNYLIAYLKAARDLNSEGFTGPETIKIMTKYTKVPEEVIKAAVMPIVPPNGDFNVESVMSQQRYHLSRGKLTYKDPIPAEKFINTSYLKRALDFLGRSDK